MGNNTNRQKGSALISALFIMTLVAIAATAMSYRLRLDIYRTSLTIQSTKLYLASQLVSFWSMSLLSNPHLQLKNEENAKVAELPKNYQTIYPEAQIRGTLYDVQARFNLNNLADKKLHKNFLKLLSTFSIEKNKQESLVRAIVHWISPYQPGQDQEYLSFYQGQKPPYLPSQQPFYDVSEIRLIQGVSAKIAQQIVPFITILPKSTPININTASREVLATLGNGLNRSKVLELISARGDGFHNESALSKVLKKLNIPREQVTMESVYFESIGWVQLGNLNLKIHTLLKREKTKKGIKVHLIHQWFG